MKQIQEQVQQSKFQADSREKRIIVTAQAIKKGNSGARFKEQRRSMALLPTEPDRGRLSREFSAGITQGLDSSADSQSF